jgi:hypothetical protein
MSEKKAKVVDEKEIVNETTVERKKVVMGEDRVDLIKLKERPDFTKMDKIAVETEIKELEELAGKLQAELAETEYPVKIENDTYLKELIKFVEHDIPWQHRNAALVVSVYQELKSAKATGIDKDGFIWILGKDIATIYNSLAQRTGAGFFQARVHIRLVTVIGETISEAMKLVADDNQSLRDIHTRLSELDKRLQEIAIEESGVEEENIEEVKAKAKKLDESKEKAGEILEKANDVVKED